MWFFRFRFTLTKIKSSAGVPTVAQQGKNLTSFHKDAGSIPGLTWWVKGSGVAVSCGIGHRHSSDLVFGGAVV